MNNPKLLVIYHKNCLDGFAAAWVVRMFHEPENVQLLAADYGDAVPDLTGRDVVIVDFSYKPEHLLPAAEAAKSVLIIDHHKSAITAWSGITSKKVTTVFSDIFSGAVLTWRHYMSTKIVPRLFNVIQDYDLWEHKIPTGRAIIAAIKARGVAETEDWDMFSNLVAGDLTLRELEAEGDAILRANAQLVASILERNTRLVNFMGFDVPVANVPYELRDAAGEALAHNHPFAVTYDDWHSKGIRKFSLRSSKHTPFDVEKLARYMGGGGHAAAAGFTLGLNDSFATDLRLN